jgi:hypothetical protein
MMAVCSIGSICGEAFVQPLAGDVERGRQQRESDVRHADGCRAQSSGSERAPPAACRRSRDCSWGECEWSRISPDALAVLCAGGVVKLHRPRKQRAVPAPRETLTHACGRRVLQ